MGALSGTMTATSYRVGTLPSDWKMVMEELTRNRFKELRPEGGQERSFGWVLGDNPFATDFSVASVFWGNTAFLGLRLDSLKVSSTQLKFHLAKAASRRLEESGKERLARAELAELKDEVLFDLTRRTLPTIKVAEMAWNTESGRLWFFSRSAELVEIFEKLFTESFGVDLVVENPYSVARDLLGEERADKMLDFGQSLLVETGV